MTEKFLEAVVDSMHTGGWLGYTSATRPMSCTEMQLELTFLHQKLGLSNCEFLRYQNGTSTMFHVQCKIASRLTIRSQKDAEQRTGESEHRHPKRKADHYESAEMLDMLLAKRLQRMYNTLD